MDRIIYLDNAATTRMKPEVIESMRPYLEELYGNPSGSCGFSGKAKRAAEQARREIASFLGARPEEIYFTGGGTESDNWAIKATAYALREKGKHIITTKIEHHAVLHTCAFLEQMGFEVTSLAPDESGIVHPDMLESAIRPDTILISVMAANNEIGTIQPLREIGAIARSKGILFHTDAVQAYGHIPIDVEECHIDMLSASAHKINGPKGCGILYIRNGVQIGALLHGGMQERGRRAGTLYVPGIVGFGTATKLARETLPERMAQETALRDFLIERILKEIPFSRLNGHRKNRLPNNAHFSFSFVNSETLLISLDQAGICASVGSACTSGAVEPSHVLSAIGLPDKLARGSLRLTLSDETTEEEIDLTIRELKRIVERQRSRSAD